ncbi:hypothetical protein PanWU01x14_141180 [Parasponia andersonii]|uniref:Uncharacterized protein n=1 Tax=Parasponia andersonii TaxID=3476 RepID=A0A2P5CM92_PARAD|nr:hypothetical protein PanWU01x14_141180 [Parasponia andersonii]
MKKETIRQGILGNLNGSLFKVARVDAKGIRSYGQETDESESVGAVSHQSSTCLLLLTLDSPTVHLSLLSLSSLNSKQDRRGGGDTWVITKHLRSQLDASALNRFCWDEADRITVASRQVTASSQLAGTNDLVAPSNLELEEAVRLVAAECVRLREEESAAPKKVKGSETGPSVGTSPIKGKPAASRAQAKAPAGRRLAVHTKGTESAVPHPDAGGSPAGVPPAFLASRGETMATPGLTKGSAAVISPIPDSCSKSSAASPSGEIADLSGGAPRLKSRLSSPPPVPAKRQCKVGSSDAEEVGVAKRGRVVLSSDSDDPGATLTLIMRKRSGRCSQPRGECEEFRGLLASFGFAQQFALHKLLALTRGVWFALYGSPTFAAAQHVGSAHAARPFLLSSPGK